MDTDISFNQQEIDFKLSHPGKIRKWILKILQAEKRQASGIHYIFCTDEFLLGLNLRYLGHKTLTDILTFDYSEGGILCGDIYISVERVEDNAEKFKRPFDEELRRVMIHGVLHLMGYTDKTASEKASMRKKEEACLSLY